MAYWIAAGSYDKNDLLLVLVNVARKDAPIGISGEDGVQEENGQRGPTGLKGDRGLQGAQGVFSDNDVVTVLLEHLPIQLTTRYGYKMCFML